MVKIITFEGLDYSGKTTTLYHMAKKFSNKKNFAFNEGPIYPTGLTARFLTIANQANEQEREFLYTTSFVLDTLESTLNHRGDNRTVFQDRYWPSVIAYGKFLNREKSIHHYQDFRPLFISPVATIYFSCTLDEKIRRSEKRARKSVLDRFLLGAPDKFKELEKEIDSSLEGLPNILRLDTTNRSVEEVAFEIEKFYNSQIVAEALKNE